MKRTRSGLGLRLHVLWIGHTQLLLDRLRYLWRDDVGDGIEACLSAVSFVLGIVIACVGRHPTIMDNIIAADVDGRFPNLPAVAIGHFISIRPEAHNLFGVAFTLCGLMGVKGVFYWPSPGEDGKMRAGIPPRILTGLLFQRLCGSIAAVMFWMYNVCVILPFHPHSIVGTVSLVALLAHFGFCVRAAKRYEQDKSALKKAALKLPLGEKRETLHTVAL